MEKVNHPNHYGGKESVYEAIKVIEAWNLDFSLGNVIKYISRAGKKSDNVKEDLEKAKWYLERAISNCAAIAGHAVRASFHRPGSPGQGRSDIYD